MRVLQANLGSTAISIATGASAGSDIAKLLIASGVTAQAVPVVGNILGGIALVAGFIAKAQAKASAIKDQASQVDAANVELLKQNSELDQQIQIGKNELAKINTELARLGLQGMGGFSDWLKKTFAPAQYQTSILNDKVAENNRLQKLVEEKITTLQSIQQSMEQFYNKLTRGKSTQQILLWVGGGTIAATTLYLIAKHYKWI